MNEQRTPAQSAYKAATEALLQFCETSTDLTPVIMDEVYPFRVQYIPEQQMTMFENENIDENGEVNDLTITVGMTTSVKSTLKFKMDSKLLKKLIKLAERVGDLYYHAYRESQDTEPEPAGDEYEREIEKLRELYGSEEGGEDDE